MRTKLRLYCFAFFAFVISIDAFGQGSPGLPYEEPLPLYYDVNTGNATIDLTNVFGGETAGYAISWSTCDEPCIAFRPENHTPFMGGVFVGSLTDSIGENNFSGVPAGVYSLGDVFPVALSEQELIDDYFTVGPTGKRYFVIGPAGSEKQHAFQPVYGRSPFPAINDPNSTGALVVDWGEEAELRYNALTGGLSLHTDGPNGGALFSYEVVIADPVFDASAFTPISTVDTGGVTFDPDKIVEISWAGLPSGDHQLGSVLPSGLSNTELSELIVSAQFLGEPGHDVGSLDIDVSGIDMAIQHVVPEPGISAITLLLLVLGITGQRTRRK